jgi:hypothetical protein
MEKSKYRGEVSMKRLFAAIFTVLILFVIYYDLSTGTLPLAVETSTQAQIDEAEPDTPDTQMSFFEKKVESGDTVLSIIESQLDASIPVSIDEIVQDFSSLNDGLEAEKIQIGKKYRFPDYSNLHE